MPFQFDSDGFLTDNAADLEAEIRGFHEDLFRGAREINRACHELLSSVAVHLHPTDHSETLLVTLFLRSLEHYQATLILLNRGMVAAARVALRSLFENVTRLVAIARENNNLNKFIDDDSVQQKKILDRVRHSKNASLEEARRHFDQEKYDELVSEIKEGSLRKHSTEEWSKYAELHDSYVTMYTLLSQAVHTQARDLEDYINVGDDDRIQRLEYAPKLDGIPLLVATASEYVMFAASAFDHVFKAGFASMRKPLDEFVANAVRALDERPTR